MKPDKPAKPNRPHGASKPDVATNPDAKLSEQQKRFCVEYLKDFNGTRAALAAKYSPKAAQAIGSRLLSYAAIQKYIQSKQNQINEKIGLSKELLLGQTLDLAVADLRNIFDDQGRLKSLADLPENISRSIEKIKVVTKTTTEKGQVVDIDYIHEIKLWDKLKAIELLGRHLKIFTEKMEHTGADGKPLMEGVTVITPENALSVLAGILSKVKK